MTRQAERGLEHLDARIAETDGRILELENELVRGRGDLQALQDRDSEWRQTPRGVNVGLRQGVRQGSSGSTTTGGSSISPPVTWSSRAIGRNPGL